MNLKYIVHSLLCNRAVMAEWSSSRPLRGVNRGITQGSILSPSLGILVVNELLKERGCGALTYAGDVALLVKGKFLKSVCELTKVGE